MPGRVFAEVKAEQRPKTFAIERGSGDILLVLERDHQSDDEKAMQGIWSVTSLLADGKPATEWANAWDLHGLTGTCNDFGFTIDARVDNGSLPGHSGPFFLDIAKKPKTITIRVKSHVFWESTIQKVLGMVAGDGSVNTNEKTPALFGIYSFDGERLTIAYRAGGPRPEKFDSASGLGRQAY